MDLLITQGIFGEERKTFKVTQYRPGGTWEIFVNDYREGSVNFYRAKPIMYMHERSLLSGDDLWILLDMLQSSGNL